MGLDGRHRCSVGGGCRNCGLGVRGDGGTLERMCDRRRITREAPEVVRRDEEVVLERMGRAALFV
jgi:hypothetical protein